MGECDCVQKGYTVACLHAGHRCSRTRKRRRKAYKKHVRHLYLCVPVLQEANLSPAEVKELMRVAGMPRSDSSSDESDSDDDRVLIPAKKHKPNPAATR